MAVLIGNAVIIMVCIVAFQKLTGSSTNLTQGVRNTINSIDRSLVESQQNLNKKRNPQDFCNAAEFLLISSMLAHPQAQNVLSQFDLTNAQAKRLSRKLLAEVSHR